VEWERQYSHFDWAYGDYTGFPQGEYWPEPAPNAEPAADGALPAAVGPTRTARTIRHWVLRRFSNKT